MFGNIACNLNQVQIQVEILGMLNRKIAGALLAEQPENALGLFVHRSQRPVAPSARAPHPAPTTMKGLDFTDGVRPRREARIPVNLSTCLRPRHDLALPWSGA